EAEQLLDLSTSPSPENRRRLSGLRVALSISLGLIAILFTLWPQVSSSAVWMYRSYEEAALARPIITKSVTSGVAYLLGDAIAQSVDGPGIDRGRVVRSATAGLVSHGPQASAPLHVWCLLLDRYCRFGGAPWALAVKIGLDQTLFASYINAAFCVVIETLRRQPPSAVLRKARRVAPPPCNFRPQKSFSSHAPAAGATIVVAEPQGLMALLASSTCHHLLTGSAAPACSLGRLS
ncbi:MAG: hypothetical protein SGPRY_010490, partial [Prymnesium sp.]